MKEIPEVSESTWLPTAEQVPASAPEPQEIQITISAAGDVSLGNFCFGANRNPKDKDCLIIQQTFTFIDGIKQDETQLKVIPCSVSSVTDRNDYKPTPAVGKEADRILDKLNKSSLEFGMQFNQEGYPVKD